jgi:hypothetical protein
MHKYNLLQINVLVTWVKLEIMFPNALIIRHYGLLVIIMYFSNGDRDQLGSDMDLPSPSIGKEASVVCTCEVNR